MKLEIQTVTQTVTKLIDVNTGKEIIKDIFEHDGNIVYKIFLCNGEVLIGSIFDFEKDCGEIVVSRQLDNSEDLYIKVSDIVNIEIIEE